MFARRAITCRQAVELMSDYLEGTMSARARARFEAHLATCPHCREYLRQMTDTIAALGRVEAEPPSPEVCDELVDLFRQAQPD